MQALTGHSVKSSDCHGNAVLERDGLGLGNANSGLGG
jgi:hypothetical protein